MTFKISSGYKKENNNILPKNEMAKNQISFKGWESAINSLGAIIQTNELVGPTVVDIVSMVIPRTCIDATRGKDAGIETFARETTGYSTNCLIPGFVAMAVGGILGKIFWRDTKIKTSLATESSSIEMLHKAWTDASASENIADKEKIVEQYVSNVLNKTEGLVGKVGTEKQGWKKFEDEHIKFINNSEKPDINPIKKLADLINRSQKASRKELKEIKEEFVHILGASENIKVDAGNEKNIKTTAKRLVNEIYIVGREVFTKIEKPEQIDKAVNKLTKISKIKSALTLSLFACFAFSLQFINRHMTKKRTGSGAFVGLSKISREEDAEKNANKPKTKFHIAKALSVAGILGIAAASIANTLRPKEIWQTFSNQKSLLEKLEFNSKWTHLNQIRTIYAFMIAGRILASADKHELRETDLRDMPGFLNWLVLGGFVAKGYGKWASKGELINASEKRPGKKADFLTRAKHFLANESLVSHNEIKERKITFEEAEKILLNAGISKLPEDTGKMVEMARSLLNKQLNKSIFAGIAYSTLMLGTFIPWINKRITNALTSDKKHPANQVTMQNHIENSMNNEIFADFINTEQKLRKR